MLTRPAAGEHAEFYATYVTLVPDGDFVDVMTSGHPALLARLRAAATRSGHRYADGKWSVAESLQHMIDTERVFAYRMLSILRGAETPLPGFDHDAWVPASVAHARDFGAMVDEFALVRASTAALIATAPAAAWANRGTMSGGSATARALPYIIAGHERHHDALFRDRYDV